MDRAVLENLLADIEGAAFATLDATTQPAQAVTKITTGIRVILFTNKRGSDYERLVRVRLTEAGKNPNNFELGDPRWGTRVPNSPLIEHKGKKYLQCVELTKGQSRYYFLGREANPADLGLKERPHSYQGGLSPEEAVVVRAYDIAHIDRLHVDKVVADSASILPALVVK